MKNYTGPTDIYLTGGPLDGRVFRHPLAEPEMTKAPEITNEVDDGSLTYRALPRGAGDEELDADGRLILYYLGKQARPDEQKVFGGLRYRAPTKCNVCGSRNAGWYITPDDEARAGSRLAFTCSACDNVASVTSRLVASGNRS